MARKALTAWEVGAVGALVYIFRDELRALAGTRFGTPTPTPGNGPTPGDGNGNGDGGGNGGVARPLTLDGIRRSLRGELR